MKSVANILSPFSNFLVSPRHRLYRHIFLIMALVFVTLNFGMPYIEYQLLETKLLIIYLASVLAGYILIVYFTLYFLIPRYLLQKKYLSFVSWLTIPVCILLLAQQAGEIYFCRYANVPHFTTYHTENKYQLVLEILANFFVTSIALTGGAMTILLKSWLTNNQKAAQLEKDHLRTEVENLKEQINPGFMFQTLHYAGTLEESNPARASDILIQLSRLLRYQLYDCNHRLVFLQSEIHYIENYLSMEQTYLPRLSYTLTTEGEINTTLVPPLLFIPFIQFMINKMKAGQTDKTLDIAFGENDDTVIMQCNLVPGGHIRNEVSNRIPDLEKTIRRLRILFGNNYELGIYGVDAGNIDYLFLKLHAPAE